MKTAAKAIGPSRRLVISGLFATVTVAPALAVPIKDLHETVRRDAEALAASMKALHGGQWSVRVNHEMQLVLVISEA